MNSLYPLKFKPILKSKIWGGTRLVEYGKSLADLPNIGESWELSGFQDNVSEIANGFLAGNDINDIIEIYMSDLVGDAVYELFGNQFPLLFKFIDADSDLSIQVHPDNDIAFERHNSMGKTEMWYIIDANKDAKVIIGLEKGCSRQTYLDALNSGKLDQILHHVPVHKGDTFFISPGCVHSICKGVLLAEIQQSSDITYRIYDYDRIDSQGNKRELHTKQSLEVINFEHYHAQEQHVDPQINKAVNLATCPYFTTNLITFNQTVGRDYAMLDSFVVYMCVEGQVDIQMNDTVVEIKCGETVLLPACATDITLQPKSIEAKLLEVYMDNVDKIE